jgi:hypothetical protein
LQRLRIQTGRGLFLRNAGAGDRQFIGPIPRSIFPISDVMLCRLVTSAAYTATSAPSGPSRSVSRRVVRRASAATAWP